MELNKPPNDERYASLHVAREGEHSHRADATTALVSARVHSVLADMLPPPAILKYKLDTAPPVPMMSCFVCKSAPAVLRTSYRSAYEEIEEKKLTVVDCFVTACSKCYENHRGGGVGRIGLGKARPFTDADMDVERAKALAATKQFTLRPPSVDFKIAKPKNPDHTYGEIP